jgi:HPt (histidine-containing phosphotransfer) domain-containing protein
MSHARSEHTVDSTVPAAGYFNMDYNCEILDFEALVNRCMGKMDFVDRVLLKINERLPLDIEELEQAFQRHDAQQIAGVAHRIKGATANISANKLQCIAQEIESMGREGTIDGADLQIAAFKQEWENLKEWTTSYLAKTDSHQ